MAKELTRREFVRESVLVSAAAMLGAGRASSLKAGQPPAPSGSTWTGKIGKLELSRLMLGGNLITGAAHSRDLRYVAQLMYRYNTADKIAETLALAEQHGINSINTHVSDQNNHLVKQYRKKHGDKMKWIMAVYAVPMSDNPYELIDRAKQEGADAIYLWGCAADGLVLKNMELVKRTVERMRATGLPVGIAAHTLNVIVQCEKAKLEVDFYQKTFHSRNYAIGAET